MGRQGVTWAGKIALKINPHILEDLSSPDPGQNLRNLRNQWKNNNQQYALCGVGKGRPEGSVQSYRLQYAERRCSGFVLAAGPTGRLDADYACIEVDGGASTRHVFPGLKPDYMLLTNLFRDQLDRYGEIDITMNILEEMIRTVPKMQVIVNVDDALSAYLAMDSGNPYIT